jgi:hypothetical protein
LSASFPAVEFDHAPFLPHPPAAGASHFLAILLTPGFSPVGAGQIKPSRFNGLAGGETVETVLSCERLGTRLKPGVNEKRI